MSDTSSSSILNALFSTSTSTQTIQHLTSIADNELENLKLQQKQLQQQLLKQELINTNLYQSLIDSGLIQLNNLRAVATTARTTVANFLDVFQSNRGGGGGGGVGGIVDGHTNTGGLLAKASLDGSTSHTNRLYDNYYDQGTSRLTSLASILPLNDMFTGLGSVFEKLFGTKFWLYGLFAIFICIILTFLVCCCTYCCCCTNVGKFFSCCFKCFKCFNCFKSSSSSSKKKKLKQSAIKNVSGDVSNGTKCFSCV